MAISFIVPDLELNNKITRALVILNNLSVNKAGTLVLNIDKLAIADFFVQHPFILHAVLRNSGKKLFDLQPEEINAIGKDYPNTSGLFSYNELKVTLQILLLYGFATVKLSSEHEAVYSITESGNEFINGISSDYIQRLNEISKPISQLLSSTFRQLMTLLKPYTNGK
jgi:hypothetical protein